MAKKNGENQNYSMEAAMRLAQTDAARQLLALLQQQNGVQLQQAMEQAGNGDLDGAKDTLSRLLASPEARSLMQQLQE